ncbi:universal stress protein UspA [Natrinema sp. CBA1119]|uniref:universal stress protein n=1 Tax=Natrinema sp. CBA1119 TaxID=1608465 RepID=UPI000BF3A725|nr:universal stress protein [Natrinema sp. CBA1119]PGF17775.1 universal stress protein UspA [Natrinema sp. CBA1119]
MYKVLLAVDTNEDRSTLAAEAVANLPGEIEVVLLNVFEEFNVTDGDARIDSSELYDEDDLPESVTAAEGVLEAAGIDPVTRREHGEPTEVILSVAEEIDADSIAVSGRKRSPAGKAIFGSVTQSLLLSADRPVIVATSD